MARLLIVIEIVIARVPLPYEIRQTLPMKDRHERILGEVVRSYLDTGRPVGSRSVAEHSEVDLSPASIRSVMADLEKQGMSVFGVRSSAS